MERKPEASSGSLFVVDSGRKRRQPMGLQQSYSNDYVCDSSKRPPQTANGNGETLTAFKDSKTCRATVNRFRNQMSYVAKSVIMDSPSRKRFAPTFNDSRFSTIFDDSCDELQDAGNDDFFSLGQVPSSSSVNSRMSCVDEPVFMVFNDDANQIGGVNSNNCVDLSLLREALTSANLYIHELIDTNKKLRIERTALKTRFTQEATRAEELHRILLERNLRMKQVLNENVRWGVRYSRLKQLLGEEDVRRALGELAPDDDR